ncbi:hypothetical protein AAMO2058_001011600 [Amorphochlora amoebiformis]
MAETHTIELENFGESSKNPEEKQPGLRGGNKGLFSEAKNKEAATGGAHWEKWVKYGIISLMLCVIIYLILDYSIMELGFVDNILKSFLLWVRDNPWEGACAFAGVYAIATILFIPGSILTLGAGLVFGRALGIVLGVVVGSISVFVGATVGALCAFLLGRYVLHETAQRWLEKYKIMTAVDKAIETKGFTVIALFRLSPVIPFSAFNYIIALTKCNFRDYFFACIAILPGTIGYVFVGTSASGLLGGDEEDMGDKKSAQTVNLIIFIVGGFITIVAVFVLGWYSKRVLTRLLKEAEEQAKSKEDVENDKNDGSDPYGHMEDKKSGEPTDTLIDGHTPIPPSASRIVQIVV